MKSQSSGLLLVVVGALMIWGCGDPAPNRDEMTPAAYFEQTQESTMTPNGRVVPGSARDVESGRLQYDTEDGSTFEVTPRPTPQGGYRYENPQQILPSDGQ